MKLLLVLAIISLIIVAGCTSAPETVTPDQASSTQESEANPIDEFETTIVAENDSIEIGEMI